MAIRGKCFFWSTFLLAFLLLHVTFSIASETRMQKTASDGSTVILTFMDAPLKTMTETPFKIEIIGPTGRVIKDAQFNVSLDMPDMPMPPNHPKVSWQTDSYQGIAVFTMAGAWQAFINIQRPGYDQEQVVFNIDEVLMK